MAQVARQARGLRCDNAAQSKKQDGRQGDNDENRGDAVESSALEQVNDRRQKECQEHG
jgi:hypothetical protein